MSTQQTSARRGPRPAAASLIALALTAAVIAVAIQASSVRSARIGPEVSAVPARTAPTAEPGSPTGTRSSTGCWRRKFGCGHGAGATAISSRRTGSRSSEGCWRRKFPCPEDAPTSATRP
jgi:hypothetical protein